MKEPKKVLRATLYSIHKLGYRIKTITPDKVTMTKLAFIRIMRHLKDIEDRRDFMSAEIGMDMTTYEDKFFSVIEDLLKLVFNKEQLGLIQMYLFQLHPDKDWDGTITVEKNNEESTVPFKRAVIPFLDQLTDEAEKTQSVNTIYLNENKLTGHNTDIIGFEMSLKNFKYDLNNKEVFILGAGGVVPSIIFALIKMGASKIIVTNRTKEKVDNLKNLFQNIEIVDWGEVPNFDMIVNATSVGLKKEDNINIDFSLVGKDKFFFDVIYNPSETNFLKIGKNSGNLTLNGKMMFIYQAFSAFTIWHGVEPKLNEDVIKLLDS